MKTVTIKVVYQDRHGKVKTSTWNAINKEIVLSHYIKENLFSVKEKIKNKWIETLDMPVIRDLQALSKS